MKSRTRIALTAIALLAALGNATVAASATTSDKALAAPSEDLAQSYLWTRFMVQAMFPAAEKGVTIHVGGLTINKSNVAQYQQEYERPLATYREVIKRRGYMTIAGVYKGKATEACARIQSLWVRLIVERRTTGVEIVQDGPDAQLIVSIQDEGRKLELRNRAAIVESAIALQDGMNGDFYFRKTIKPGEIELKPDISVLRSWPKWAGPPRQEDLKSCTVVLRKPS